MPCGMNLLVYSHSDDSVVLMRPMIKAGILLTGGEDSNINVWTCLSSSSEGGNDSMDIDDSPSRKRFVSGMDVDVSFHFFFHSLHRTLIHLCIGSQEGSHILIIKCVRSNSVLYMLYILAF